MTSGIYVIENKKNHKKYVGSGKNVEKRMRESHHTSPVIHNAITKYGKESFDRYIIRYCSIDELYLLEQYYIKKLYSHISEWGYNISWGGESGMRGRHHSERSRKKISESRLLLDWHPSKEQRKQHSERMTGKGNPHYGVPVYHSEEQKEIWRKNRIGSGASRFGKKNSKATSKYFGVSKVVRKNGSIYWQVLFVMNKKREYVGCFKTELEAAYAYDKYIKKYDFNRPLNFPDKK